MIESGARRFESGARRFESGARRCAPTIYGLPSIGNQCKGTGNS